MHQLPFLDELVIILLAAVVVIFVSRPLKIPSVVGFLLTGILIGPSGFNLITEQTAIHSFAEVGVVMLLFVVGLEFSVSHLRSLWKQLLLGGGAQVLVTIGVTIGLFSLGSFTFGERILFGCLIALSSTAIVVKLLADRSELDTPHGKLSIGILLFQDFCIVPMIVFTPLLSGTSGASLGDLLLRLLVSIVAVGIVMILARTLMPKILDQIVRTGVREAFLFSSLLVCLLLSVVTASLGFSYALGAFIAGLIVSETRYHFEVVAEIVPFRDLFTSLFFISIGMLLDREFVLGHLPAVAGLGFGILALKAIIVMAVAFAMKSSPRTAIITGLSLAQVGEFSFVLAQVGLSSGILTSSSHQHFLGASIVTMMISPIVIGLAPAFAEHTQGLIGFMPRRREEERTKAAAVEDHVVIVGYGVNGKNLGRVLRETGIPFVVVEIDSERIKAALQEKLHAIFGDITRREILERAGVNEARALVLTISDPRAARTAVRLARGLNPNLHILVRTRLVAEIDQLMRLGANQVIPEEFETSVEIFTRVLDHYHIPRNVINGQIQVIRDENYSMLRGVPQTAKGLDRLAQWLTAGTSDTFLVTGSSSAVGRSLGELNIHGTTGASLIAVVRNGNASITPAPDFQLEAGDILVLVGNHATMDRAFQFLTGMEQHKDS